MENSYGIGVRNRYELFYDDDVDPLDLLKQTEKRKKDKNAEKENKVKPAPKNKETTPRQPGGKAKLTNKNSSEKNHIEETTKDQSNEQTSKSSFKNDEGHQKSPSQPNKVPRNMDNRVKFSDREERNNRRNKQDGEKESRENVPPQQRFDNEGGRGARRGGSGGFGGPGGGAVFGRGGRGGRRGGGRGGQFGEFRGKREFDRQSGMVTSSVKAFDKREGSGSFNWGSDKEQIEEQLQNDQPSDLDTSGETDKPPVQSDDANPASVDGPAPTSPTTEGDATLKDEEGPKEMTLDEWKASQKRIKPQFNIRKAGEGENSGQWKKTYVLKKKEVPSAGGGKMEEEYEEEDEELAGAHGRRKVLLPIDFQFSDTPSRGRGGRGRGRGGPGRGRGMGGGRGMRGARYQGVSRQEAPRMDDERDFPSLG